MWRKFYVSLLQLAHNLIVSSFRSFLQGISWVPGRVRLIVLQRILGDKVNSFRNAISPKSWCIESRYRYVAIGSALRVRWWNPGWGIVMVPRVRRAPGRVPITPWPNRRSVPFLHPIRIPEQQLQNRCTLYNHIVPYWIKGQTRLGGFSLQIRSQPLDGVWSIYIYVCMYIQWS